MRALVAYLLTLSLLAASGCTAPADDTPMSATSPDNARSNASIPAEPSVDDVQLAACAAALRSEGEPIGEACEAVSLCQAACVAAASLGCRAVMSLCGAGTVVTLGTVTIPCAVAAVAACGTITAGMIACTDMVCGS